MRLLSFLLFPFIAGCSSIHYSRVQTGELKGKLVVQWISPDEFIFLPDPEDPLTFRRANGDVITPGKMYTDGGSIPRPLWAFRSYSPWGYAPAFIVHDWLFDMHHCQLPGHEKYTNADAAMILSEVMKTMMVDTKEPNAFALYTIYEAVNSPIAQNLWDHGDCNQPELAAKEHMLMSAPVPPSYLIEWPIRPRAQNP